MRYGIWAAGLAAIALLPAGCGGSDDESSGGNENTTAAANTQVNPEQVAVGVLAARVRGHNAAALERYQAGDREAALEQAKHAADTSVGGEGGETAAQALQDSLQGVVSAIQEQAPESEVKTKIADAAEKARAVEGDGASSDAYKGSVIAGIASVAAHEYEESLQGGRVARADEYLEGYGFLQEARAMYEPLEARVREQSAAEAAEIEEAFEQLDRALPSGEPPAKPAAADDVERAAKLIGAELEETVGAQVTESDPQAIGERIEQLLDRIASTYDPAAPEAAAELSAEAYLENYEVIEAGVIDAAPEVNEALEPLLGAELRKQIRAGASKEEIEAMVNRAKVLLRRALASLESGG